MAAITRLFRFLLSFEKSMKLCIKYMYTKTLLVDTLAVSYKKMIVRQFYTLLVEVKLVVVSFLFGVDICNTNLFFPNIYHSLKNVNKFHTHIKIHTFQDI